MRSARWRVVQWIIGAAVLGFAIQKIVASWPEVGDRTVPFELHPLRLVVGVVLLWVAYAGLIMAWRALMVAWGAEIAPWRAARLWAVSNLGKYVPGKVWAMAGLLAMAKREAGVTPTAAGASAIVQQLLGLATGAAVVFLTGRSWIASHLPGGTLALWIVAGVSVVAVLLLLWPPVLTRLLRLIDPAAAELEDQRHLPVAALAVGAAANTAAWLLYGVALWIVAYATLPSLAPRLPLLDAISAYTGAYVAGVIMVFAPGGFGIREGVLAALLGRHFGAPAALALALTMRVVATLAELGLAAPFLLAPKERTRDA